MLRSAKKKFSYTLPILLLCGVSSSQAMQLVPTIEDAIIHNPEYRE